MTLQQARTLIVIPENGTMMEPEVSAMCPELSPLVVARVPRSPGMLTLETLPALEQRSIDVLEAHLSFEPDIVIFACTVAGMLSGPERHERYIERLRQIAGVDVVAVAPAMTQALRASGVTATTVVTPYMHAANEAVKRYLRESGIDVEYFDSFYPGSIENLMKITEDDVRTKVLETVGPKSTSVFVSCAQLPAMNIIPGLRKQLGMPVWSAIVATAWAAAAAMAKKGMKISLLDNEGLAAPVTSGDQNHRH